MKEIKMYSLTKHAEQQYRTGAKQGRDIDISVLNRKISSLIYASEDRFYFSSVDACVAFGTCMITFAQDEVIDIRWVKENHRSGISKSEKNNLLKAYEYFKLDKDGMEFKKISSSNLKAFSTEFDSQEKCEQYRKKLKKDEYEIYWKDAGGVTIRESEFHEKIGDKETYVTIQLCDMKGCDGYSNDEHFYKFAVFFYRDNLEEEFQICSEISQAIDKYLQFCRIIESES